MNEDVAWWERGLSLCGIGPVSGKACRLGADEGAGIVGRLLRGGDEVPGVWRNQSKYDELVEEAQERYPKLTGKVKHHVTPKYLGGDPKGPMVEIDAAYHQLITNEFRHQWRYRLPGEVRDPPSAQELDRILDDVYSKYPLPK